MNALIYNETLVETFLSTVLYNVDYGDKSKLDNQSLDDLIFLQLFIARTKYLPESVSYDIKKNVQFHKVVVRSKDKFLQKLKSYQPLVYDRQQRIVPLECLSIYTTLNPRDPRKALFALQKDLLDISFREDIRNMKRLDIFTFKAYHTSPIKMGRAMIDFDPVEKDEKSFNQMMALLQPIKHSIHTIVETHGGYHVYVNLSKASSDDKKYIFQHLRSMKDELFEEIKVDTDPVVPIPGTLQGGFKVRILL